MLNRLFEHLRLLEKKIDLLIDKFDIQSKKKQLFGEWVPENEIMQLTGLSRNTLLKLRQEGRIIRSTISGKRNYYRLSDFKKILDENEGKEEE